MQRHCTVDGACRLFGRTRQAYYKQKTDRKEQWARAERILDAAREIRSQDPRIGGYKLWLMLKDMYGEAWVPGRDSFFELLRQHGLVLPRPKPRHTTNSNHRYRKYSNLACEIVPCRPNELWVSDITYIDLEDGCCYLHLVTDAYSHKIVGWCLADSLKAAHSISALEMAIGQTGMDDLTGLVHHSDRGVQYCCNDYVNVLNQHNVTISMTEDYKPTDNAVAERVNGIIKQELVYPAKRFADISEARSKISSFIAFYNNSRPHMSIGMQTPSDAHRQIGPQERLWTTKTIKRETSEAII